MFTQYQHKVVVGFDFNSVKEGADDLELRHACETAMEGNKQKVVLSIRVAKSQGVWGKSGKIGKGQMAKPKILAISSVAGA